MTKPRVFVATVPFAGSNQLPIDLLNAAGIEYVINPVGRKLTESELLEMIRDYDGLIAGTEPITAAVMRSGERLKVISRVGVGLDSVDLPEAKARNIVVAYTPDAPAPAVAELTVGLMLSLLRHTHVANQEMHRGDWNRHFGRRIAEVTIGVIGVGRIGGRVLRRLPAFGSPAYLSTTFTPIYQWRTISNWSGLGKRRFSVRRILSLSMCP